jgi:hypothetical protein
MTVAELARNPPGAGTTPVRAQDRAVMRARAAAVTAGGRRPPGARDPRVMLQLPQMDAAHPVHVIHA